MRQIDDVDVVADMVAQAQKKLENAFVGHNIETLRTALVIHLIGLFVPLALQEIDVDHDSRVGNRNELQKERTQQPAYYLHHLLFIFLLLI